jgi:hypothetical protein
MIIIALIQCSTAQAGHPNYDHQAQFGVTKILTNDCLGSTTAGKNLRPTTGENNGKSITKKKYTQI